MIIKDNDKTTYYETHGDKSHKPILLIHGIGAEVSSWMNQIDPLKNNGYFVITLDMYGHGKSSNLSNEDLDEWNSQIIILMEHLKLDKIIICGVSMGGVIAQHFTITYPQKIKALIVSDSFGELKTTSEKLLGISQIIGFNIFKLLGNRLFAKGMAEAYKQDFAIETRKYMYESSLNADFNQLIKARKAINKIDSLKELSKLTIPALVTVGDSFGQSFIDINKKISDSIKNSKFVIIKNSMDPSPMVNPTTFNNILLDFLKRVD